MFQLASSTEVTPSNARFFDSPVPITVHIISVSLFGVLGAFQVTPAFLRRKPAWHRRFGRILIPAGLLAGLTGLWMTVAYDLPAHDGALLYGLRLVFGGAMVMAIVSGVAAIGRRDYGEHGEWMLRAYAIGMGAGTQAFILGPVTVLLGEPSVHLRAILMGAGWVINVVVAERVIRSRRERRRVVSNGSLSVA